MTNIMRVRTLLTGVAGSPYYSNLYFGEVGGVLASTVAHDLVSTFWTNAMANLNNDLIGTVEGEVALLTAEDGVIYDVRPEGTDTITVFGQSDPLPPATQGLARFITSDFVDGRRVRGRMFIPGQCEINNGTGIPTSTYISGVEPQIAALVGDDDAPLVIWSRPVAADAEADPPVEARAGSAHVVTGSNLWTQWASLRSRRD